MFEFLSKPYALNLDTKSQWKVVIFITMLPVVFFFLFKPFGLIANFNDPIIVFAFLGFGVVTAIVIYLFSILLPYMFKNSFEKLTVGGAIIYYLSLFLCISIANYIYKCGLEGFTVFSWTDAWTIIYRTSIIGIAPLIMIIIWHRNSVLKDNLEMAEQINLKLTKSTISNFTIHSENKKKAIQLQYKDLLFIASADNYVEVFYIHNYNFKKKIVRNTLKNVELQINNQFVVRCHRSYIVNLKKVISASGNSKGLFLELENVEKKIPVSKSYFDTVSKFVFHS